MAEEIAIKVDKVSKAFKLPHEKTSSIKSAFINSWKNKKTYERQQVLKEVSFNIKKGEFFGIVGRNGSGKSTLLKLLAGIYAADNGSVTVNGKLTPFIELGVGFNPELTGRENVFLNGALLGFDRTEMTEMYEDIVKFAELEKFMDQKLKNYSSGMQVRLAFSIAIRVQSDILLIDEVLAVGDESFQRKCMEYFVKLKRNKQTVVFVTHDMSQVRRFCDRAIYVEDGEILTIGTTAEVAALYSSKNLDLSDNAEGAPAVLQEEFAPVVTFPEGQRVKSQSTLVISLSWKASRNIKHAGIAISKDTGEFVFASNTMTDNFHLESNTVTYRVECNLTPAKYSLAVGLFGETDADIIFYKPNHAEFIVDPSDGSDKWAGITKLNHTWK
jgi:ABC-type polysaccharide/polyol phosphate transport system ATPase subunit